MSARGRSAAILMWTCIAMFAARVLGQVEALLLAPDWLPDMDAWYSGLLPYPLLLPAQIAILMTMTAVAWNRRVRTGRFAAAHPRVVESLRGFALLYAGVMALRLAWIVVTHGTDFWRHGAIPVAFHWVLALFILVSARRSEGLGGHQEADDTPHGDVPRLAQPLDGVRCGHAR
jgi:hypothetical protein